MVPDKGAKPMFRKLLFSGVTVLGLMTSTTLVPSAQADDRDHEHHRHHHRYDHHYDRHYAVVYQDFWYGPWRVYGIFHSSRAAHETAESLRFRGIPARVVYR
jgi:hypothetical protein